jgi:hypothetical protein
MKRIHIHYDGTRYTVADRGMDELKAEIAEALAADRPHWLKVNYGEGAVRVTEVLIARGIGVALTPIDPASEEPLEAAAVALPAENV